jgi:hypothetical protein
MFSRKKDPINIALQGLDDDTAKDVLQIEARHGEIFETRRFAQDLELDESENEQPHTSWLEAQKTGPRSWTLRERKVETGLYTDNGTMDVQAAIKSRTKLRNASFWEVLYHCAQFEQSQILFGKDGELHNTHFRDFAENEGLPIDMKTGMPLPVINGVARYDQASEPLNIENIIHNSLGNVPTHTTETALTVVSGKRDIALAKNVAITKHERTQRTLHASKTALAAFNAASKERFTSLTAGQKNLRSAISFSRWPATSIAASATGALILPGALKFIALAVCGMSSFMTLGIAGYIAYRTVTPQTWQGRRSAVNHAISKIEKHTGQMEKGELRDAFQEMADEMAVVSRMLTARATYRESQDKPNWWREKRASWHFNRLSKEIAKRSYEDKRDLYEMMVTNKIENTNIDDQISRELHRRTSHFLSDVQKRLDGASPL